METATPPQKASEAYNAGTTILRPRDLDLIAGTLQRFTNIAKDISPESDEPLLQILETGCGEGDALRRLVPKIIQNILNRLDIQAHLRVSQGYSYIGIDTDTEALQVALSEHQETAEAHFLQCLAQDLPFPENHFSLGIAAGLLTQVVDTSEIVRAIHELIRVSKVICILDFRLFDPGSITAKYLQERLGEYVVRYSATQSAFDVPYGTIISTQNLHLEQQLRNLERDKDIQTLREVYSQNSDNIRFARHFSPIWLQERIHEISKSFPEFEIRFVLDRIRSESPSGNPLYQFAIIGAKR